MRVVCDANVLISALISSNGVPARIVEAWVSGAFELVMCPKLLGELRDVFNRSKLREVVDPGAAAEYVGGLEEGALVLSDPKVERPVMPDPDDDYLVALAAAGDADCLVSGDRLLTDLADLRPLVLTLQQFVDLYL